MKRIIIFICIIVLLISMSGMCFADNTTMIDELGFSIDLPSDVIVFTQDTSPTSPLWDLFNADGEAMIDFYKDNDMYLNAIPLDCAYEITIIGQRNKTNEEVFDLNLYSDKKIKDEFSALGDKMLSIGYAIQEDGIYQTDELKCYYMLATGGEGTDTVYLKSYITIYNGISVQTTLRSYSGSFSSQDDSIITSAMDSIHFSEKLTPPKKNKSDSSVLEKAAVGAGTALLASIFYKITKRKKKTDVKITSNNDEIISEQELLKHETYSSNIVETATNSPSIKATADASDASIISAADEILKYKQLLDNGIITQEEFVAKKKQLLGL